MSDTYALRRCPTSLRQHYLVQVRRVRLSHKGAPGGFVLKDNRKGVNIKRTAHATRPLRKPERKKTKVNQATFAGSNLP